MIDNVKSYVMYGGGAYYKIEYNHWTKWEEANFKNRKKLKRKLKRNK